MRATSGSVRSTLAVCVCLAAAVSAPVAWADDPPPGGPAIGQYVETVPSSSGGRAVGVGQWHVVPLSKKAQSRLRQRGTPLEPKLRSIATSSNYGAPQGTLPRRSTQSVKTHAKKTSGKPNATPSISRQNGSSATDRNAISAAVSAATGSGSRAPLILLVVIVLLTTAAGIVAAATRARRQR